ncbi:helix-turn-helix domain-containing protein [Kitasatospora sp. NPDC089509]|uniref:helix-turn-helix domain-containing protein n=1 Tax=Kitasatospora sp. NPDC089509 TaxID=3364079 RepID=UPI0038113DFD
MKDDSPEPYRSRLEAFGRTLRSLRRARGLTQAQLGRLINYSGAFVSYVELGDRPPPFAFATRADSVLGSGGTLESLWWALEHTSMLKGFFKYASYESKAVEIRHFQERVIPGLLQTREYAAAIHNAAANQGSISQNQADERTEFAISRQRIRERRDPPHSHFIMDESCIHTRIGSPDVTIAQLQHLEDLADDPSITIQVFPFARGEACSFAWPAIMLTLPDRSTMLYSESKLGAHFSKDPDEILRWEQDWRHLQNNALSPAESLSAIRAIRTFGQFDTARPAGPIATTPATRMP